MKIAFLGDSITLGYALENKEQDRFSGLVCRELGAEEMNLGITGTLIAKSGMSASDGTSFLDRLYRTAGCDFAPSFLEEQTIISGATRLLKRLKV